MQRRMERNSRNFSCRNMSFFSVSITRRTKNSSRSIDRSVSLEDRYILQILKGNLSTCTYNMYITSTHILTCCFSCCLVVMADLKRLDYLSVEEAIAVWKDWRWEANLLPVAATKDSRTVKSIASVMDTHGYSEQCKVLKGM